MEWNVYIYVYAVYMYIICEKKCACVIYVIQVRIDMLYNFKNIDIACNLIQQCAFFAAVMLDLGVGWRFSSRIEPMVMPGWDHSLISSSRA